MLSIKSSVHCIGNFPEKVIKSTLDKDTGSVHETVALGYPGRVREGVSDFD